MIMRNNKNFFLRKYKNQIGVMVLKIVIEVTCLKNDKCLYNDINALYSKSCPEMQKFYNQLLYDWL